MNIERYLAEYAAFWAQRPRLSVPTSPNDPETERPFLRFVLKAVLAHGWMQSRLRLPDSDIRSECVRGMREHAADSVRAMAYLLSESVSLDRIWTEPLGGEAFGITLDPDAPDGWLFRGLSALSLELLTDHAGTQAAPRFTSSKRDLAWIAGGFRLERAFALAEAGRCAARRQDGDKRLRGLIDAFRAAGELWGDSFIVEARHALSGRLENPRSVLKHAIGAIRQVPELPHDAWSYLKPHMLRHDERFKIGPIRRFAIRVMVNCLTRE